MVTEPGIMPNTTPVAASIEAIAALLLLQVPPTVASDSGADDPAHTFVVPLTGAITGSAFTVSAATAAAVQPKPFVTV